MPLLDSTLAQVAFAFVMIGLFALILRWTFSSETHKRHTLTESAAADGSPKVTVTSATAATAGPASVPDPTRSDDYGLLASAAALDSLADANQARTLLSHAGIRATTATGADGRHRVLVFIADLHRARRLITRRPAP